MNEEFVRKDVFDIYMQRVDQRFDDTKELVKQSLQRMEAIMEKNLERHDAIASDIRVDNIRLEGKIDALAARLDAIQNKFSWNLAWVGELSWGLYLLLFNISGSSKRRIRDNS